jgi:hypothetical protein
MTIAWDMALLVMGCFASNGCSASGAAIRALSLPLTTFHGSGSSGATFVSLPPETSISEPTSQTDAKT